MYNDTLNDISFNKYLITLKTRSCNVNMAVINTYFKVY